MKPGQKFGQLTVQKIIENKAECSCKCGCSALIYISELESGSAVNCGMCHLKKKGRGKRQAVGRRDEMFTEPYKKWRFDVYKKYGFKCVCCESKTRLNAHHLQSWDWAIHLRYDVENGVCLCYNCHNAFHNLFGRGANTKDQFIFFLFTYYGKHL